MIAAGLLASASPSVGQAGVLPSAAMLLMGQVASQAPAQATSQPANRKQVDAMLAQARQAITHKDFARADALLAQADASGISYPVVHFGDTPARVRKQLEKAKLAFPQAVQGQTNSQSTETKPTFGSLPPKAQVSRLLSASRELLKQGRLADAEQMAAAASQYNLPESDFAAGEDTPARLAWDLQKARYQSVGAVQAAGGEVDPNATAGSQALYQPGQDATQNRQVNTLTGPANQIRVAQLDRTPSRLPRAMPESIATPPSATALIAEGEEALRSRDLEAALERFEQADLQRAELNPMAQSRLDAHLQMLSKQGDAADYRSPGAVPQLTSINNDDSMLDTADEAQKVLLRQLSTEVGNKQIEARRIRENEPRKALQTLTSTRDEVAKSQLSDQYRSMLLKRIDRGIAETEKYIEDNRSEIELDEKNAAVLADIDRSRTAKRKVREQMASLIDQFNKLIDDHRYEEAEVVAKRLRELAPNDPVALQVWQNAKFIRREMMNRELREQKDVANIRTLGDVDASSYATVFDNEEMSYAKDWDGLPNRKSLDEANDRRSETELQIEQSLKTKVQLRYNERPLSEVMEDLAQMAGINVHLDPRGLSQEGVSTDQPISIELNQEVMLKSALNLILEPLNLNYVVKDEVLKITSDQLQKGELKQQVYYVADLVTPIPNFVPSNNIGLQGLINSAHAAMGYGAGRGFGAPGPISMVNNQPQQPGGAGGDVLAQQFSGPQVGPGGGAGGNFGSGPGGLGGGANADFDSLIDLIISTVASDSWAENGGGEAEIRPYFNNLSLVVSQTQAVHEEIADLLEQLRRLQDLQITIEVRFIRLNDSFFERIGIDFDVNINDKTVNTGDLVAGGTFETPRNSTTVGIGEALSEAAFPAFTNDLDIPFRQGSFGLAVPTFGGPVAGAASFGFAILSDIEAYFLINAAQGDRRTNVLNAPKVTLFNGQTAFVADTSQQPFVISVIPVVGEFAAAQQPVIVVLSEGTLMNIQAVVSEDRRYVRLTVVPFFSTIGDVQEFTFEGSSSTSSTSTTTDDDQDGTNESDDNSNNVQRAGTTVQLPTFQFVSVSTTVSVPDGGTVLLGGIKRLNEGRNEFGVPLLSKVPYINRLFRNVGIGRETDSLMMMVTPRIIIQEEEEQRLGIAAP